METFYIQTITLSSKDAWQFAFWDARQTLGKQGRTMGNFTELGETGKALHNLLPMCFSVCPILCHTQASATSSTLSAQYICKVNRSWLRPSALVSLECEMSPAPSPLSASVPYVSSLPSITFHKAQQETLPSLSMKNTKLLYLSLMTLPYVSPTVRIRLAKIVWLKE